MPLRPFKKTPVRRHRPCARPCAATTSRVVEAGLARQSRPVAGKAAMAPSASGSWGPEPAAGVIATRPT
jgi:hypothetical protein